MGLFEKSGSSFLNFSIMDELDKDKNIKSLFFYIARILIIFFIYRMNLLILSIKSHIIKITQIKGGFNHGCYCNRI